MERVEQQPDLIKLSDSENLRLREPLQNLRGLDVYDSNGEQIGTVEDLYVDQGSPISALSGCGRRRFSRDRERALSSTL